MTIRPLAGKAQGVSYGGRIELAPDAGTQVLIHELTHELLHARQFSGPRKLAELEAEATAYVVARHYGMDGLNSPNYLALWGANAAGIRASLTRIQRAAVELIEAAGDGREAR